MMAEWGLFCLILALSIGIFGGTLSALGLWTHRFSSLQTLARSVALAQCFFVMLSFFTLMLCFGVDDFSVKYVAENASKQLPLVYKLCAVWGGHEGSLLLWAFILTLWTAWVTRTSEKYPLAFSTRVLTILISIQCG